MFTASAHDPLCQIFNCWTAWSFFSGIFIVREGGLLHSPHWEYVYMLICAESQSVTCGAHIRSHFCVIAQNMLIYHMSATHFIKICVCDTFGLFFFLFTTTVVGPVLNDKSHSVYFRLEFLLGVGRVFQFTPFLLHTATGFSSPMPWSGLYTGWALQHTKFVTSPIST